MKLFEYIIIGLLILTTACDLKPQQHEVQLDPEAKIYDPAELEELLSQQKISIEEQVDAISALRLAFKSSYIGWNLKKRLTGIDAETVFKNCAAQIKSDINPVEYYDLIKSCLAGFDDSHLNIRMLSANMNVTTAISEVQWIAKKLLISKVRPQLIDRLVAMGKLSVTDANEFLRPGTEILTIDGQTPISRVHELSRYISSSSAPGRKSEATYKLFSRNYAYPKKASIELFLRSSRGVSRTLVLPWVQYLKTNPSRISRSILRNGGILPASDYDPSTTLLASRGADLFSPLFDSAAVSRSFVNAEDFEILNFKEISSPQKLCYIQLFTFAVDSGTDTHPWEVYELSESQKKPLSFLTAFKDILQNCESKKLPLVFDLRDNGGGNARLADILYMYFETNTTKPTYYSKSILSASGNLAFFQDMISELDPLRTVVADELYLQAFLRATRQSSRQTPWIISYPSKPEIGYFTGRVLITTGNQCVSACENFINRMKKAQRAIIIGESTNGTGFGFSSTTSGATFFRDPLNLYEIKIPNHAFQISSSMPKVDFIEDETFKGSLLPFDQMDVLENRPLDVDFPYYLTMQDLKDLSDYRKFILNIINTQP